MNRDTKSLLIAGGLALTAGTLIYLVTRTTSKSKPGPSGPAATGNLDALLDEVAATATGPDYETVLTYGDWTLDRERSQSYPGLGPGSIVRLRMYPSATGYDGPHYDYAVQITKAYPVQSTLGNFSIYEGTWINTPGGLDANTSVSFTSADVSSVNKKVSPNA